MGNDIGKQWGHGITPCDNNIGQHHETTLLDNNMGKPDGQQNGTISWENGIGLDIEQLFWDKTWDNDMEYWDVTTTWDNNIGQWQVAPVLDYNREQWHKTRHLTMTLDKDIGHCHGTVTVIMRIRTSATHFGTLCDTNTHIGTDTDTETEMKSLIVPSSYSTIYVTSARRWKNVRFFVKITYFWQNSFFFSYTNIHDLAAGYCLILHHNWYFCLTLSSSITLQSYYTTCPSLSTLTNCLTILLHHSYSIHSAVTNLTPPFCMDYQKCTKVPA